MGMIVNIAGHYTHELDSIANITHQLKKGRIYELMGAKMDGDLHN